MGNTEIHRGETAVPTHQIASSRLLLPHLWTPSRHHEGAPKALPAPPQPSTAPPPRSLQSLQPASGNSLQPLCVNIVSVSTGLPILVTLWNFPIPATPPPIFHLGALTPFLSPVYTSPLRRTSLQPTECGQDALSFLPALLFPTQHCVGNTVMDSLFKYISQP